MPPDELPTFRVFQETRDRAEPPVHRYFKKWMAIISLEQSEAFANTPLSGGIAPSEHGSRSRTREQRLKMTQVQEDGKALLVKLEKTVRGRVKLQEFAEATYVNLSTRN